MGCVFRFNVSPSLDRPIKICYIVFNARAGVRPITLLCNHIHTIRCLPDKVDTVVDVSPPPHVA